MSESDRHVKTKTKTKKKKKHKQTNKMSSSEFSALLFASPDGRPRCSTSWPISMAHSLADWSLASTITLNMVHMDGEMRKSVDLLLFVSLDSNAIRSVYG
ncbi:hypothetical protein CRUP_003814 [Coryphaenoides rupestris]|nr:hypothetical protein CRUP_003814 [Coryphaenoides rupestris]